MKPSLQLKLSTHLTLTPQLQQSIRLLQMSTIELSQELELMIGENPLLERLDDPLDYAVHLGSDGVVLKEPGSAPDPLAIEPSRSEQSLPEDNEFSSADNDGQMSVADTPPPDGDFDGAGEPMDWGADSVSSGVKDNFDDDSEVSQVSMPSASLREHLHQQLQVLRCEDLERGLISFLIDNLNEQGYVDGTLDELFGHLPQDMEIEADDMKRALSLLQSFDPAGVGSRDLVECLLIQLDALPAYEWPADVVRAARVTVKTLLPQVAARDFVRLRQALMCDADTLKEVLALIRSLDPKPGLKFGSSESNYVIPDVVVKKIRNHWRVMLNSEVVPRLRVNEGYVKMLGGGRSGRALSAQVQEARWLVKNVEQRFETIQRVSQAIVDRQKAYFNHGELAMRPLVLREIAEELGLHESTISRVTTNKYMLTPFGTLELKYFFGSHVGTEAGGSASSTAIRALIKQIIQAEEERKPLSDSRIAEMLGEQGFVVARRTVAKYREGMDIPPVSQRKCL